jgi:hypothetical protein
MNNPLKGIGAGLVAAARSLVTPSTRFQVGGIPIVCPICGHDEFTRRSMLMNTSGMTLLGMDWLILPRTMICGKVAGASRSSPLSERLARI